MSYLDNINQELYRIKELIKNKKYKQAVFSCSSINDELIDLIINQNEIDEDKNSRLIEDESNYKSKVMRIITNNRNILRKYEYYYQDVFDRSDAEKMYFSVLGLIDIYNQQI